MPRFLGSHLTLSEGIDKVLKILDLGLINTAQVHPSPPQMWLKNKFSKKVSSKLSQLCNHKSLEKLFFHGIYLINLASSNKDLVSKSIYSILTYLELLHEINGEAVVFHPGSITDGAPIDAGLSRVAETISTLLKAQDWKPNSILLEVSAGKSHVVGSQLWHLSKIRQMLGNHPAIGIALDTQHLWASGYDLKNNLDQLISEIRSLDLLNSIKLIHINDSKTSLGSHIDRHENIGDGFLGREFFGKLFAVSDFTNMPFVLETPRVKTLDGALQEIKTCLSLAEFEFKLKQS